MFDLDKWQEIFETIRKHKLRTLLTAFGIFWGIFMLILLLGCGNGLQNGVEYSFRDDAVNSIWIYSGETTIAHKGMPIGQEVQFKIDDLHSLVETTPGIDHFTPRNNVSGSFVVSYKKWASSFGVRCTYPGHQQVENTKVEKGRFLNDLDVEEKRQVAVIGLKVQETLYENGDDPIGTYINIKGIPYKVVGTFSDTGSDREMRLIYIPWSTANQVYNYKNNVQQMMLTTGDAEPEEVALMVKDIRQHFAERKRFSIQDKSAIYIRNNIESFQQILGLFTGIRSLVWFVGIGTLAAGIIGVSNIMLIIVKERTKEIGLRKALGATPWSIISLILQESIFITATSGYLGLLAGLGCLELLSVATAGTEGFFKNPEVDFQLAIIATIILVIAGAFAGFIPASRAAKVSPIEALREN